MNKEPIELYQELIRDDRQATKEEAIFLAESGFWKELSYHEIATFQMWTKRLSMPFPVFHEAIEKALGRPVYTHEFGLNPDGLRKELYGEIESPTLKEIIDLIPEDKRIIIFKEDVEESG